jgi:hypothetical protein
MAVVRRVEVQQGASVYPCAPMGGGEWLCGACPGPDSVQAEPGATCACGALVIRVTMVDGRVLTWEPQEGPSEAPESPSEAPAGENGDAGAGLVSAPTYALPDGRVVRAVADPALEDWVELVSQATGLPVPEDDVLREYQRRLLDQAFGPQRGEIASCVCGRDIRDWKRRLHLSMRRQILAISRVVGVGEPFRLEDLLEQVRRERPEFGLPERSDETKLPHFGLLIHLKKSRDENGRDNPNGGKYVLPQEGLEYAQERRTVPKYAYFYNATLLAVSTEQTALRDDGDRFDWQGLMEGLGG